MNTHLKFILTSIVILQLAYNNSLGANSDINSLLTQSDVILNENKAFNFTAMIIDEGILQLDWNLSNNIYLYRDKISISSDNEISIKPMPEGEIKTDKFFGKMEVFYDNLSTSIRYNKDKNPIIYVSYQGCHEKGYCYPLINKEISIINSQLNIKNKL